MIPKVIHYCWFGGNPLPKMARKCIASWRKFFPEYEIKEWNESNFDVNCIPYTKEAYSMKKYAFVSDYARFWILYHEGGIYFDTDVEVIRSFDDIIEKGPFMGMEYDGAPGAAVSISVAPGLGLAISPGSPVYKQILNHYESSSFLNPDGSMNLKTVVLRVTEILAPLGYRDIDQLQHVGGIWIYPHDFFCPMDSTTGIIRITENTRSIHHFDCSWIDHKTLSWQLHVLKNKVNRLIYMLKR